MLAEQLLNRAELMMAFFRHVQLQLGVDFLCDFEKSVRELRVRPLIC